MPNRICTCEYLANLCTSTWSKVGSRFKAEIIDPKVDNPHQALSYALIKSFVMNDNGNVYYIETRGDFTSTQLVPITSISPATGTAGVRIPATAISVHHQNDNVSSSKLVTIGKDALEHPENVFTFWSKLTPTNVDITEVTFVPNKLNVICDGHASGMISAPGCKTYFHVSIENEVFNNNLDNLFWTSLNNATTPSATIYTTDGSNLSTIQMVGFNANKPETIVNSNYENVDLIVGEQYEFIVSNFLNDPEIDEALVRGYETITYTYTSTGISAGLFWNYQTNSQQYKQESSDYQLIVNNNSNYSLVAKYCSKWPTKSLDRYFLNTDDTYTLKGHAIINFKHWQETANLGYTCLKHEFDYTSYIPLSNLTLYLDDRYNGENRTRFVYGERIYGALHTYGGWYNPANMQLVNIAATPKTDQDLWDKSSEIHFPIIYSVGTISLALSSSQTGDVTASITCGNKSASVNYTVIPRIDLEKFSGIHNAENYIGSDGAYFVLNESVVERIKINIGSDKSMILRLVGEKIGTSSVRLRGKVKNTSNIEASSVYTSDSNSTIWNYTLTPNTDYYIVCLPFATDNNGSTPIKYSSTASYPSNDYEVSLTAYIAETSAPNDVELIGTISWRYSLNPIS